METNLTQFETANDNKTQTQHVVESTGVLNNHETFFFFFFFLNWQTGSPVEVPPVLKNWGMSQQSND